MRSVSHHRLMHVFVRFVLESSYDSYSAVESTRTLDMLIGRLEAKGDLCLVTLRFFCSLVSLNCEDIMLELCLKALLPGKHLADGPPDPKLTGKRGEGGGVTTNERQRKRKEDEEEAAECERRGFHGPVC